MLQTIKDKLFEELNYLEKYEYYEHIKAEKIVFMVYNLAEKNPKDFAEFILEINDHHIIKKLIENNEGNKLLNYFEKWWTEILNLAELLNNFYSQKYPDAEIAKEIVKICIADPFNQTILKSMISKKMVDIKWSSDEERLKNASEFLAMFLSL